MIGASLLQMEIAKPEANYFCFEPSKRFLPILKKNIKANRWNNVTLNSKILSSEAKTITLFNNSSTASPVVQEYDNHEFLFAQQVEATTLDTVFEGYEGKIDLIKVDTDGYDYDVLLGAQERIIMDQPILYFEFHQGFLKIAGRDAVDFLNYLNSLGYNNFGVFSNFGKWLGFRVSSSEIMKLADQEIYLDLLALPEKDYEKTMLCACSKSNTPETSVPGSDVNLSYGTKVSFATGGNSEPLKVSGWSGTESQMTWTEGTAAVLAMRVSPTNEPVVLRMKLGGLTKDPEVPYQPVEVYVNDQKVADWQLAADPAEFSASIPQEITRRGGLPRITLKIPKATSPKALGMGADPRILGVACFDLQLALKAG